MRLGPRASLVAGVAALLPVTAAVPAFARSSDSASDPALFFLAQTSATAVHVTVTQQPASSIITASLFDDAVAYAASDFDTGGSSEALAAPAFPGRLVVQGPELLCSQLFSCPAQPPAYPLLADASYPRRPDAGTKAGGRPMGAGPFVVTPLHGAAHAGAAGNHGQTTAGAVGLLAGTPGAINVGSSAATTSVRSTARRLVVRVTSTVADIRIGGLLHIATVRAVDTIRIGAAGRPHDRPSVTVAGVTVAGHRASIDDHGLHVDGSDGPALARQLAAHGVSLRTVGVHRHGTRSGTRSDATGLQVDVRIPVSGVPYLPNPLPALPPPFDQVPQLPGVNANGRYVAHVTLGAAGAAAAVGRQPTFDLGGVIPGAQPPNDRSDRAVAGPPLGGRDLVNGLGDPARQPAPVVADPQASLVRRLADVLSPQQLEMLYAVLALGSMGLFVGWRAAVRWRRA
jgi:hypothetical protein